MRNSLLKTAAMAAALAMAAGCAKKKPAELPPPPAGTETGAEQGPDDAFGDGSMSAEQRAFIANVRSDRILFETDSYSVDAEDRVILDSQAAYLQQNSALRITIEGHADERGTREYNLGLGDRRANAAKNYLASRGIDPARMTTVSWGKERPEATGSDEGAWARNRRAVTIVAR